MQDPDPPHPGESTEPGTGSPRDGGAQKPAGRFAENLPPRYGETEGQRPLGKGGIGEVVVARELRLMREVALKRLRSDRTSTAAEVRLAREACVTGLLEHPGIIPVHDIDRDDQGRLFYTMKQVGGRTLRELIEMLKPADPDMTPEEQSERAEVEKSFGSIAARLEMFLKVCDAIAFAHSHPLRVIHRDLKPENVIVGDFGEVMVMDWGLAKVLGEGETAESLRGTLAEEDVEAIVTDHTATLAGQFLGTPAYAPPEQLEGRLDEIDERSDIYALGGILYHLLSLEAPLTGEEPYTPSSSGEAVGGAPESSDEAPGTIPDRTETASAPGDSPSRKESTEVVRQWCLRQIARRATARRLRGRPEEARRAGIPEPLAVVILKALEPDPKDRMASVKDLARQVRLYVQGFAGDYERAGAWRHFGYFVKRHRSASITAAVALFVVLTISTGFTLRVQNQLAETQRQLERSQLEEGRAWFERAKVAWEGDKDPLKALMFAGRAVGFHGYGRRAEESVEFSERYPSLLGSAMNDPIYEDARRLEEKLVDEFVDDIRPTGLPIWSSPNRAHHHGSVASVAFNRDGSRIATGSYDRTVKLWDAVTGKELASLEGHSSEVTSVAFSPDGSRIATGSYDRTVKIWDVLTGKELASLEGHSSEVTSVAFGPGGGFITSGSADRTVKLWNAVTGKEMASLEGHSSEVTSVAISPDGSRIASGSEDRTVKLWDVLTGKELAILDGHLGFVRSVAFSPDGSRVASGSEDRTMKLWDAATGEEIMSWEIIPPMEFTQDGSLIVSGNKDNTLKVWDFEVSIVMAFSPDGSLIATGTWDKAIAIRDAVSGKELAKLYGHTKVINSVAFNPDGSGIVSGAGDQTIKLWDLSLSRELISLKGHWRTVSGVAFSPDGSRIASGSDDHTVKLWDMATGREMTSLDGHASNVNCVAFSPDSSRIVSGSHDNTVKLWDAATGKELTGFTAGHALPVTSVAFSSDGSKIASGSVDQTVKLWDAVTPKELASMEGHLGFVSSVVFSPDGSRVVSGSEDRTVKLWDVVTARELASMEGHLGFVRSVAFSPDGSRIASASDDQTVKLWDAETGKELASLEGHSREVTSVAFSPDGNRIASGSEDRTVKLWDAVTGKELTSLEGHSDAVTGVAFNPDGSRIASSSADRTLKLWDIQTEIASIQQVTRPNKKNWTEAESIPKDLGRKADLVDLSAYEKTGYFRLEDRGIVWNINDTLLGTRTYPFIHQRYSLRAQLAATDLTPAQRMILRVQLCASVNSWRPLPVLWEEAKVDGLSKDTAVRRAFLLHVAIAVRAFAVAELPFFPSELWSLLAELLQTGDFSDPAFSHTFSQALPPFLQAEETNEDIANSITRQVFYAAPHAWLSNVASELGSKSGTESPKVTFRRQEFLRQAAGRDPQSAQILRALISTYNVSALERSALEDRLLAHDHVTAVDFANIAHATARRGDGNRALEILSRARELFGEDISIEHMEGWIYIILGNPFSALKAFETVRESIQEEQNPDRDLRPGLSIAQWLTGGKDEAIATYRQLIETGRAQENPTDWADPKTITDLDWPEVETKPLEEIRKATLAKHPELQPSPDPQ